MAWLVFLHVSNAYRRQGVGSGLWSAAIDRVRAAGCLSIYVSATPSASAVGFYLDRGCEVVRVPHSALYAEEPDDIHLVATIDERTRARITGNTCDSVPGELSANIEKPTARDADWSITRAATQPGY
jgi:predicted N-acetyltransferase YhbS